MILLRNFILVTAIGFISGCGDFAEEPEVFKQQDVVEEPRDNKISSLNKFEPKSLEELEGVFQLAAKENKPILLDFTAYTAVNARYFENNVWENPKIFPLLKSEFVIASLIADSRVPQSNNKTQTVGELWQNYQKERYTITTQPMYDIVNLQNESLVDTVAIYRTYGQPDLFKKWLNEGLTNFKKQHHGK